MIAALYVQKNGAYYGLPNVDPWDEERDARKYAGPWPVVAHPPCARWSRLAPLVESLGGKKRREDEGCFAAALAAVRNYGGVLEHPAYSAAWRWFGLNHPPSSGGWVNADWEGGWTCALSQSQYGHVAQKRTWLYAVGVDLPSLDWSWGEGIRVSSLRMPKEGRTEAGPNPTVMRTGKRHLTPSPFRDLLIQMAESVNQRRGAA